MPSDELEKRKLQLLRKATTIVSNTKTISGNDRKDAKSVTLPPIPRMQKLPDTKENES